MTITKYLLTALLIFFLIACNSNQKQADLVILNGKVITLEESLPEANAIAVLNDTIAAVGSNDFIEDFIGPNTKVINLKGELVIPGITDSHAHLWGVGKSLINLDLRDATNWQEVIYLVADAAEKAGPGQWIVGRGWHQEKWDPKPPENVNGYPYHTGLSNATPRNPVMLNHASGHAVFANELAMRLAGIDDSTKSPEGGMIVRDPKSGKAIGVFEENAETLITDVYDKKNSVDKEALKRLVKLTEEECLRLGITSFHDAGSTFEQVDLLKELADSNQLNVRFNIMLGVSNKELKEKIAGYKMKGYGNNFLSVHSIKKYSDGALGSRGAWLLEEYSDLPGHFGQNVTSLKELRKTARIAIENGFQLCTHAIGDRGNREMLEIYRDALGMVGKDKRWRIEHAQHLNPNDIPIFAELGIIPSMQGIHCTSDAVFVEKRLGKQRAEEGAYVWRKLLDDGNIICNGTDAPVEKLDPFANFYALITREYQPGETFYPQQQMLRMEALKAYTINGAYASFDEEIKGSLKVGKLADITILNQDLLTVHVSQIKETEVIYTIVGGEVKYSRE